MHTTNVIPTTVGGDAGQSRWGLGAGQRLGFGTGHKGELHQCRSKGETPAPGKGR